MIIKELSDLKKIIPIIIIGLLFLASCSGNGSVTHEPYEPATIQNSTLDNASHILTNGHSTNLAQPS